ncbi:MAG: protein translocase subunit SecDF [Bacteroidaceae bacterium]|nr:protein translocase subunit SecDF [Bacteroidaceae bacterium]
MQNKGIVIFTAVLLTLASLFYLSFSAATSYYDGKAAEIAAAAEKIEKGSGEAAAQDYRDSVKYLGIYSYQKCLETQVGLGLDLKGGMNVILEVSVPDMVENFAGHKTDPAFTKAMQEARTEEEQTQKDFISLFINAYHRNAPGKPLASVFATQQLSDVKTNSSDDEVERILREKVSESVADAKNVITNRIDQFGVVQPNIQMLEGQQGRIMVEMPGVKEPERMRKLLQGSANLEFWETWNSNDVLPFFTQLDQRLAGGGHTADTTAATDEKAAAKGDSAAKKSTEPQLKLNSADPTKAKASDAKALAEAKKKNPLLAVLQPMDGQLAIVGMAHMRDTAYINKLLRSDVAKQILPQDLKLLWGAKPSDMIKNNKRVFELYALKVTTADGRAPLEGDVIESAKDEFNQFTGKPSVNMTMNDEGARRWAQLTRVNVGKAIAIVLDGVVYSAPRVNGEISGGSSEISGNFTVEDTKDLANTLKSGRMKAPVRIVQEEVVGPSLGAQSIKQGIISFIVAFILLMLYMVTMYGFIPGMVANCALLLNLFFTLGIMASFQSALTMPGIAGIVLTLGMAVDANVLIYERTKEELKAGKNVKQALQSGYSNAFSAIFDSNLTSIITGVILAVIGTGPVRGFAITLIIGICCSFFTAVFLTRLVYESRMKKDKWLNLTFTTPVSRNFMQNKHFNIIGAHRKTFLLWGIFAIIFIGFFAVRGLSRSIDFTGGRNYVLKFEKPVQPEEVNKALSTEFQGYSANALALGTDGQTIRVSTNYKIESNSPTVDDEAEEKLFKALSQAGLVTQKDIKTFKDPDDRKGGSIISSTKVGPSIARDVTNKAIISVIVALIAIFLYILLRFRNVAFSVGSILALALDTLIVVGFYSALWGIVPFSLEIDQVFIGAILTVIGYSINDKVVVFDRIRENLRLFAKRDKFTLFNDSINQTLARTINTSLSTLIVLLCIFIFGGDSIRSFSFAMILGVVFGTLSSIFIAAPIAYLFFARKESKETT